MLANKFNEFGTAWLTELQNFAFAAPAAEAALMYRWLHLARTLE